MLNLSISEDSIVAKKAIRGHMLSNDFEPQSIVISNELVQFVSGACQDHLAQRKDEEKQLRLDQQNST